MLYNELNENDFLKTLDDELNENNITREEFEQEN